MKADEIDKKFDDGQSIAEHLDLSKARRPGLDQKREDTEVPTASKIGRRAVDR